MRRPFATILAVIWSIAITPAIALDGGRYGDVRLAAPSGEIHGYVVLFSDAAGWSAADQAALDQIARSGALAVGVDLKTYVGKISGDGLGCEKLVADVELLSRQLEREFGGSDYYFPILAGLGEGGTLAAAVLSQAPGNTIAGAVSVDPNGVIHSSQPLCARSTLNEGGSGLRFEPNAALNGFWSIGVKESASADIRSFVAKSSSSPALPHIQSFADRGVGGILTDLIGPHLNRRVMENVADLPLVELPAQGHSGLMAVLLSGDGGWRDLDKTIAEKLQSLGVSVVGWDSLRYFWRKKSPEKTSADLAAVIQSYGAKWQADKVALIGYSFGADILPFAYAALPQALKSRVMTISLLGLESAADWEIRVFGWLGAPPSPQATPVGPTLESIAPELVQCFYGEEEQDSYCPTLASRGAEILRTKGKHHFDGDYVELAQQIFAGFKRRVAGKS
jgi:type IV secretory pathway VirJ component